MKADFLFSIAKLATGDEPLIVEVEGYELEVYGIEYDEFEEVIRLKATPSEEGDGPPWLENDDDEESSPPGSVHDNVCPVEPPQGQSVDIEGFELKEG